MNPEISSILADDDYSWKLTLEEVAEEKLEQNDFQKCRDCPIILYLYGQKTSLKFEPLY